MLHYDHADQVNAIGGMCPACNEYRGQVLSEFTDIESFGFNSEPRVATSTQALIQDVFDY